MRKHKLPLFVAGIAVSLLVGGCSGQKVATPNEVAAFGPKLDHLPASAKALREKNEAIGRAGLAQAQAAAAAKAAHS